MDSAIGIIIEKYGVIGILLIVVGFWFWENWKMSNKFKEHESKRDIQIDKTNLDIINLKESIEIIDKKIGVVDDKLQKEMDTIFDQVNSISDGCFAEKHEGIVKEIHAKNMNNIIQLGPKIHTILSEYIKYIKSDHIFIGSFHNGNSSVTGVPYYKFDIITERFCDSKVERDCEFAPMYKDCDIMRFGLLPFILNQNKIIYYQIDNQGNTELKKYDDVIWRRMIGRDIKQIALALICDKNNNPSGFIGCIKYSEEPMNMNKLKACVKALENCYNKKINTYEYEE